MNHRKNLAVVGTLLASAAVFAAGRHRLAQAGPDAHGRDGKPAAPPQIAEICVGDLHSCARAKDGEVACWGDNERFQIAPTTAQFHEPHVIREFSKAASLRCGSHQTCVRTVAGEIHCLGKPDGKMATIALPGPARDFVIHAAGGCAILEGGKVVCWHGDGEEVLAIDAAAGATGFAMAAPSAERVCVSRAHAAPVCFDAALWSAVPQGATSVPPSPKVSGTEVVEAFAEARELLLVNAGMCGRFVDGRVRCIPDALAGTWDHVVATELLATNGSYACLRTRDNAIACKDMIRHAGNSQSAVLSMGIPAGATQLALSKDHGCAIAEGRAKCWGEASHGQTGDKTSYLHATPVRVPGIDDAVALRVAERMACVVRRRGTLSCWGALRGEVVPGLFPGFSPMDMAFPGRVADAFVGSQADPTRLCAKGPKGWRCYAQGQWTASTAPAPSADTLARVGGRLQSIAPDGFCAVDSKGQIVCGHCGACTLAEAKSTVTRIPGQPGFVEVAALIKEPGANNTLICGRNTQDRVRCVRAPAIPFQHESSPSFMDEPTIAALENVRKVAALGVPRAEANLVCALTRAGVVYCWGDGQYGQLGEQRRTWSRSAEPIAGLPPVVEIGVGGTFACARTEQGQVYCWGSNREGAVPDGAPGERTEAVVVR